MQVSPQAPPDVTRLAATADKLLAFSADLSAGAPAELIRERADWLFLEVQAVESELAAHTRDAKGADGLAEFAAQEQLDVAAELLAALARGVHGEQVTGKLRLVAASLEAFARPA